MESDFKVWWAKFKKNGSYSLRDEDIAWFAWAASKANVQQTVTGSQKTETLTQIAVQIEGLTFELDDGEHVSLAEDYRKLARQLRLL